MPAAKKKRPHKQIFLGVAEQVAEIAKSHGFVDHPMYETGWEPTNQMYDRYLIREDTSEYIDQFDVSYIPAHFQFSFKNTRSKSTPELLRILSAKSDTGAWTDAWLRAPCEYYRLNAAGNRWQLLMGHSFCLKKRDLNDPDAAIAKIMKRFRGSANRLFEALEGNYKGWAVWVDGSL